MNFLLIATSSSFLIVGNITKHLPLKVLWVVSSLNHANVKWINLFDKALAHTICLYSIVTCPHTINKYTLGYWFSCLYTVAVFQIYKLSYIPGLKGDLWHGSIHIISSTGMVLHYYANPEKVHWTPFLEFLLGFYLIL